MVLNLVAKEFRKMGSGENKKENNQRVMSNENLKKNLWFIRESHRFSSQVHRISRETHRFLVKFIDF